MIEKVNPDHPDKIADRIAGAIIDLAYKKQKNPKIAVEVLIGHNKCCIISETSIHIENEEIEKIVKRILKKGICIIEYREVSRDIQLARNQEKEIRCGDNGIFKGVPVTKEQNEISNLARDLYSKYKSDGKYILDKGHFIICQSNAKTEELIKYLKKFDYEFTVNPLGDWTGGINVDTVATNRKLGSDMADSITGGGLHGKDLSKADVSVNIYAFLKAQETGKEIELCCAIGDTEVDGKPYSEIVSIAKKYIDTIGGFEKFAEWGLF